MLTVRLMVHTLRTVLYKLLGTMKGKYSAIIAGEKETGQ